MKIVYIGIWRNDTKENLLELCSEMNLEGFNYFTKGTVAEFTRLFAGKVAERTPPGPRQAIEEQGSTFHVYARAEGTAGVVVSDHEYPHLVAQTLLSKICDEFHEKYPRTAYANETKANNLPFPELKGYITKYQNPEAADSMMKIQKELDETKIVLHKTIESVLERGEKIDNLVAKSDGLSAQSKMFYTQAKKQNSCCVVM